jgi:hypothetical protein
VTTRYFRIEDDVDAEDRWFLNGVRDDSGNELDPRDFTYGVRINVGPPLKVSLANEEKVVETMPPVTISLRRTGRALDFTFADFDVPVVTTAVGTMLTQVAADDIQRLPVRIRPYSGGWEIINVVSCVECIDPVRSNIDWWSEVDGRPDKIGKPRMVTSLVIDPTRTRNCNILRPAGWEVALIVSVSVKDALENARVSGIRFRDVSA